MSLYLVRHAKAGDRSSWSGDDVARPLSNKGLRQAGRLAERFVDVPVAGVLSSPYVRCMQTVEPVAAARGLEVEPTEVLAEAGSFAQIIDLLVRIPDHSVLCSHGDMIPETIAALYRRGMDIVGPEDWRKGTTWVIERNGDTFTSATVWPPPADD